MTTSMNHQVEDQMLLISEYYPGIYTQLVTEQGEAKPRRRRKKNKGEASSSCVRKRKLSAEQVNLLELNFGSEHKLESERKDKLASELGLDPRQVAVWFQNRRARWKNKMMEEEYSKLKTEHDSTVLEKCRLETEVHLSLSLSLSLTHTHTHTYSNIKLFIFYLPVWVWRKPQGKENLETEPRVRVGVINVFRQLPCLMNQTNR
ncbi:hypothetical protein F0562_006453 [Nyssa sinensis]|uniref:Homeobox-leucine zipper protein n=1 Tax=Nyssa sinensis TaxID=561372 RepID=A0A5J5AM74_9ASTE|nr:hypothetical protein F0562_006453 [Nyssa sinensis]